MPKRLPHCGRSTPHGKYWNLYNGVDEEGIAVAGDNVRINNCHSIFLLQVTDDMVYYADCNASGPCKINWERSMSVADLKSKTTYDGYTGWCAISDDLTERQATI